MISSSSIFPPHVLSIFLGQYVTSWEAWVCNRVAIINGSLRAEEFHTLIQWLRSTFNHSHYGSHHAPMCTTDITYPTSNATLLFILWTFLVWYLPGIYPVLTHAQGLLIVRNIWYLAAEHRAGQK